MLAASAALQMPRLDATEAPSGIKGAAEPKPYGTDPDLQRIYQTARRDGVDFNLAYIPETFRVVKKRDFDPAYMRTLFELGEELAGNGYSWAKHPPVLFSGDLLFPGSIGRTDMPGGDMDEMLDSLARVCLPLDDSTVVLSGHGPQTTIGQERATNPYLRQVAAGLGADPTSAPRRGM